MKLGNQNPEPKGVIKKKKKENTTEWVRDPKYQP